MIDTETNQVMGSPIRVGKEPYAITISPDGKTAYVANYGTDTVSVIDTQTNEVVGADQGRQRGPLRSRSPRPAHQGDPRGKMAAAR